MWNCSDIYILVKRKETIVGVGAPAVARKNDRNTKKVLFKNVAPLTDCITKISTPK